MCQVIALEICCGIPDAEADNLAWTSEELNCAFDLLIASSQSFLTSHYRMAPQCWLIAHLDVIVYYQRQMLLHLGSVSYSKISVYFYISWLYEG